MISPPMKFIFENGMFFPKINRPCTAGNIEKRLVIGTTPSNDPDTIEKGVSSLYSKKLSVFKE